MGDRIVCNLLSSYSQFTIFSIVYIKQASISIFPSERYSLKRSESVFLVCEEANLMAFCRKFLAVSERLTAVLLCPTKEPWTKLEQLKPNIIKQCMCICVFLYVYIAFFLYVWNWSIKKKRNFYIDSFILCVPFLQILAFFWSTGPLWYYRVTSACSYRYVNLVSFMFSVSFILASTNMLCSLCLYHKVWWGIN